MDREQPAGDMRVWYGMCMLETTMADLRPSRVKITH
jgi:hypothetical protein